VREIERGGEERRTEWKRHVSRYLQIEGIKVEEVKKNSLECTSYFLIPQSTSYKLLFPPFYCTSFREGLFSGPNPMNL